MINKPGKHLANQAGVSLIEVLVAVMIVSVGLLGVARMEIVSKQSNYEALQRTSASHYASDMMTKMRANPTNLALYVDQTIGDGSISTPTANCSAVTCTNPEIATWDLWDAEQLLLGSNETLSGSNTGGLVSARTCITGPAAGAAGEYTISIAWRGKSAMTNPVTSTCGEGQNLYGANEEFRRVISMTIFISNSGII